MLLKDLRYVMDIFETKNLSKSASRLFVTQPTLTQSVKRLEDFFSSRLFERTKHGMEPTPEGILFMEYASDIIARCEKLRERMKNVTQGGKAYLKVGTGKLYGKHFMPLYIKPFGERRPDIDIEFIEDRSVILESMLLNGILDIGIIPAPIESNILISRPLFYEELFLALPRDHKMNLPYYNYTVAGTFPEIDLHLLSGEIFIISKTGYKLHDLFTNMCKMMGFKPRSTLEIESVDTIISFVRNNKGIGFVPDSFARREMWAESVNYYRIKNANCKRAFMIVHADETKLSLTAAEFVSVLFEIQEKIGYK